MAHSNNGNLLTVTNGCGLTTYTWNARNQLTGMSGFKSDCSALTASFKYDAIGRRYERTVNGTTTQYVYDGLDIIQEKQGGSVSANYIRTLNIDEPLTRIKADGTVRHYVLDALGSVITLTDDSGVVKTTYTYDTFGSVTVSGETSDNPFQYTGRENDGTGLYYYRARYYSPELQRFLSEDPIRLKSGDVNFYAYTKNSPVNRIDPLGLDDCVWAGFSGGLALGFGFQMIHEVGRCTDKCGTTRIKTRDCLCGCVGINAGACGGVQGGDDSSENSGWSLGWHWLCVSGSGGGIGGGWRYGAVYCWCSCDVQ